MATFQDNERVIVTRGSKTTPKGTEGTVLGYDSLNDTYAVRTAVQDGVANVHRIVTLKSTALSAPPERTFTESEITAALQDSVNRAGGLFGDIEALAQHFGVADRLSYPASADPA